MTRVGPAVVHATFRLLRAAVPVAVGAAAAYLLDPSAGPVRRRKVGARIRARAGSWPGSIPALGPSAPAVVVPPMSLADEAGGGPELSDQFGPS